MLTFFFGGGGGGVGGRFFMYLSKNNIQFSTNKKKLFNHPLIPSLQSYLAPLSLVQFQKFSNSSSC